MNETTTDRPPRRALSYGQWLLAAAVLAVAFTGSLLATRAARTPVRRDAASIRDDSLRSVQAFATGRHLVALVFLSSHCGFCTEKYMKAGLRRMRSSLIAAKPPQYSRVSVVGVAIDQDINEGLDYLTGLGPVGDVFDEVSSGRGWLNQFVTDMVWRDGIAQPSTPQVVLFAHSVDASNFPRFIDVGHDSVVRVINGRDSLLAWIQAGTPLQAP